MCSSRKIGYWMSDKKSQKINWDEFNELSLQYGFQLIKLDINKNLHLQGPFCVILHKLTDIIASACQGDIHNLHIISNIEDYVKSKKNLIMIDPIDKVRRLINRYNCYSIIKTYEKNNEFFTPNFCKLTSKTKDKLIELKHNKIKFPLVCKALLGHGSKEAHEMSIIFNEDGLKDCKIPCVVQNFINHNATLFKLFIVGEKFHYVERPSLKNFYSCDSKTISFDSGTISKAGAQNNLTILEPHEEILKIFPKWKVMEVIARMLRHAFGMELLGVDVIIENGTERYGIIDVNAYPGYDGFPNFFETLLNCIERKLKKNCEILNHGSI